MKIQWAGESSECTNCLWANFAQSHFVQHLRKFGITLTENVRQQNSMLYCRVPRRCSECKFGLSIAAFRNWGQLKEIASDNKLYASKWTCIVTNTSRNFLEFVKQITVYH